MKIRDIKESKQINEVDLSTVTGGINSLISKATGNGDPSSENKMAMDLFLKKFISGASAGVTQAVNSGLVAKGATAPATATADQPNASAGTSAPASAIASAPTQAQDAPQSPEQIRQQKHAAAAKIAQGQMAAHPAPAKAEPVVAKTPDQVRQEKQAAATAAIRGQEAPFSKVTPKPAVWSNKRNPDASPRSPIVKRAQAPAIQASPTANFKGPQGYGKPTTNAPSFNAQNVMPKKKIAPVQEPVTAESIRFNKLNNLFESMMYEEENKQSISQYIVGFYKKFMQGKNMDQGALQSSMPQAMALAKEAEASYPKMNGSLTKLAQLGWAVSHQQGDAPVEPGSTTPGQASSPQKVQTVYKQVKGMLDKLDKKDKQKILTALEKQLGSAPEKTTNEPISVGGQKINPTDPLYAKMQKQMAGK